MVTVMDSGTGHARGETSRGKSKDGCRPSRRPGSDQQAAAESAGFCRGRPRSMWWELHGVNASQVCWSEDGADESIDSDFEGGQSGFFLTSRWPKCQTAFGLDFYLVFLEAPAGSEW